MKMRDTMIGAGAVLLAFGGLGSAAAFASSPSKPAVARAVVAPPVADTGTTQSGDQTTPDVPGAVDATEPAEAAANAAEPAEAAGATEAVSASDGPGGHADPAGDVNNEQTGNN